MKGSTPVVRLCAAVAALLAATACSLDFGKFDPRDASVEAGNPASNADSGADSLSDANVDGGATGAQDAGSDAGAAEAGSPPPDATGPVEASGGSTCDASASMACGAQALTCTATCAAQLGPCLSNCQNSVCQRNCDHSEMMCAGQCANRCMQCSQNAGCGSGTNCGDAGSSTAPDGSAPAGDGGSGADGSLSTPSDAASQGG